ncbi:MAG: hypothetical protein PHY48_15115, partial [Candidatus Cloacimonetes bacterium]|nr:hypothetical protein [Candidatus Cloacimonadota bacterium]
TLTSTGIVNADGGINIPTGRVIAIADAPIAGTSAVNMNYITANYATISGVSGAYAPKAGDLSQTFAVSEPASSTHAIPKSYADSNYANLSAISDAINSHGNSGDHDERYVLAGNTAKSTVLNTGFFKTRIDMNGQPDVFSINGNSVDLFASEESPTTIFVPAGIDINGIKSEVMSTTEPVTNCFSITPLLPSTTHYVYVQTIGVTDITITGDINSQLYDWTLTDETVDFRWESTALFWEITWTALGEITGVAIYNNVLKEILLCSGTRSGNVLLSTITLAEEGGSGLSGSVTIQAGYPIVDGDTDNSVIIGSTHSKIVSGSFGYSLLEPIYSIEEPASPVLSQIWFSINDYMHMEYDGAGWLPTGLVFLATITTDAASTPVITALSKSKIAYDMRVAVPTLDDQAANKEYVDTTVDAILTGQQFKITPEGGYATKMVNLSGNATVKGAIVRLVPGEIIESGDTSNQLSGWQFFGQTSSNTNLGTVYWDLIWTLTGQITTINIYKDLAKTQLVASGTRSGNTTAGEITLTASNASGLTGLVNITGGASPIQDNDDANTLFIGVDNAVNYEEVSGTMPVGVFYESGIANGEDAWVVISGTADVLLENITTNSPIVRGGALVVSPTTAGRADWHTNVAALITEKQIGYTQYNSASGTDRLARAVLHWN